MKSIIEEQRDWTMRDWEIAAGTLGEQARFLLRLLTSSTPFGTDCSAVQLWETSQDELQRVIVHLTTEAAHCASKAESEAIKLARFLGADVSNDRMAQLTRDCYANMAKLSKDTYDRR